MKGIKNGCNVNLHNEYQEEIEGWLLLFQIQTIVVVYLNLNFM